MSLGVARLFGMEFCTLPAAQALAVAQTTAADRPRLVVTINIDHVVSLADDAGFRAAYGQAALRTLDGAPLVWLARMRGARGVHRVTGHDLLDALIAGGPAGARRIFALAATAEIAHSITVRLIARGWTAEQVRTEVPAFGFERDEAESARLARAIREHQTDWLLMGVGAPKSEKWVVRMGGALGSPVALCIGDALSVAAGARARAPKVLQSLGLEWVWRFAASPRRLFRRYFIRSRRFPLLALRDPDLSQP